MNFLLQRFRDDAGEGVISTGIAVLIMAIIGAAMFVAFNGIFDSATEQTEESVDSIVTNG